MPPASNSAKKLTASLHADAKEFVPRGTSCVQPPSSDAPAKASAPARPAWGAQPSQAVKQAAPMKPGHRQPSAAPKAPLKRQPSRGGDGKRGSHRSAAVSGGHRDDSSSWARGKVLPIELLCPEDSDTPAVLRRSAADLLAVRLSCLAPPSSWTSPPAECLWEDDSRMADIERLSQAPRTGGDVVFPPKKRPGKGGKNDDSETAPPLDQCKPIEVNDETRWKAKVFQGAEASEVEADSKEEVIRKALLILNKLSLTKFDKLSDDFIRCGIGRDVDVLTEAVGLIVNKAQEEQHFSSMYAGLCLKLANTHFEGIDSDGKRGKKFKKILLERCQTEFETDTAAKIQTATKDVSNDEEVEYQSNLIKKHYLGHMRFIGELYKGDLISIKIMLSCLPQLISVDEWSTSDAENNSNATTGKFDEEKVECFAKLMTVIGSSLERQSEAMRSVGKTDAADNLAECWKTVEILAGKHTTTVTSQVSNRIKFMLQDLLEMKQNGWVTRRQEESAKTLSQIHNEVAREERAKRSSSSNKGNIRRGVSSGDVRVLDKAQKPQVDKDGFVSVVSSKSVHRSASMTALQRSQSDVGSQNYTATVLGKTERSTSKLEHLSEANLYFSPDVCGTKAKCILKEYFVGGDTDDAVLSLHELVGVGDEGSLERGAKVIESAILYVLEMKHDEVDKFLSVYLRCAKENKLEAASFIRGLNDPLEFLSDIAVDAPLATDILIRIVAELVKEGILQFDFLLNSPEYFRTDQNAAKFGVKVMKYIGGNTVSSSEFVTVIAKLMTEEEKSSHLSVEEFINSL